MLTDYAVIQQALALPFEPEQLDFREGGKGTALVYVELWDYLIRLDAVAPGWQEGKPEIVSQVTFQKTNSYGDVETVNLVSLLISITIAGETRYGISDLKTHTSAYAQAFKRACANHGLGRYLYAAPEMFDAYRSHKLTVDKSELIARCYETWGLALPDGFQVRKSAARYTEPESSYDDAPRRPARQQSDGEQNPDQHKGKLTPGQVKKLYATGLTDADILAMGTKEARDAVTAAFEGMKRDEILETYGNSAKAAASGGRSRW